MNRLLFALLVGCLAGGLDTVPMVMRKMAGPAVASAFVQCFVVALALFHLSLPLPDPVAGALVSLVLALPIVIALIGSEPKSIPIVLAFQTVLGLLDGLALAFLKSKGWL